MEQNNAKIYVYRYIFQTKSDDDDDKPKLCVKYISDVVAAHDAFKSALLGDPNVVSAIREYVSEIDCTYLGSVDHVKVDTSLKNQSDDKDLHVPDVQLMEEDK